MSLPVRSLSFQSLVPTLSVLAVLPQVVFGFWLIATLWQAGHTASSRALLQTADVLAAGVNQEIAVLERQLRLLGELYDPAIAITASMREQAQRIVRQGDTFNRIVLSQTDGVTVIDTARLPDGSLRERFAEQVQRAATAGRTVVSDVQPDPLSGRLTVIMAVPLPSARPGLYVMEGELDTQFLTRLLANQKVEDTAAIVLSHGLDVLARSDSFESSLADVVQSRIGEELRRQSEQGVSRVELASGPTLVAWRRIPFGWAVVVGVSATTIDTTLRATVARQLVAGLVILVASLILGTLAGQQLSRSISTMSADTARLAKGEIPPRRASRIAEISLAFSALVRAGELLAETRKAREQTTAALVQSEQRLSLAIEASRAGTIDMNLLTDTRDASPRARELLGLPLDVPLKRGQMIGAIHPDDRSLFSELLRKARLGRDDGRFGLDIRVNDDQGGVRWIECRGQVLFAPPDAGGAGTPVPTRCVIVIIDETERQRQMQALAIADRRKDEFIALLAHELRNPLAPLRTAVSLLQRTVPGDSIAGQAVDMSARQISHMTRLVNDLLDVARMTQGKIELRLQPMVIADAINDALDGAMPLIQQRGQVLRVQQPDPSPGLLGDRVRIMQVIENLLSNASKYTDAGGSIELQVSCDDDEVVLQVSDTGIGIAPEQLPHVFDLFTQGTVTIDRAQGGLGIGLSLVRSLVELHGGRVTASSLGMGQGARFVVRLPRRLPQAGTAV